MNLFDFGFGKVSEVVNNFVDEATPSVILFSFVGLALGIGLVLFISKKGNFKKGWLFKIIYSIFIPILFMGFSMSYSIVNSAENFFVGEVKRSIVPMTNMSFPAFQLYLGFKWTGIKKKGYTFDDVMDQYASHVKFSTKKDSYIDRKKAEFANYLVPNFVRWGVESIIETARIESKEKNDFNNSDHDNLLKFSKNVNVSIYGKKYWVKVENGVEEKIHAFIQPMYSTIYKYCGMLAALLILDFGIVFLMNRKKD